MRINLIVLVVAALGVLILLVLFKRSSLDQKVILQGICDTDSGALEVTLPKCSNAVAMEEFVRGPLIQNDSRILEYIKEKGYVEPPAGQDVPYNLEKPGIDPSMGQAEIVKKIFQDKRDGFFIECGALDGETRSNTLSLERDLGWKGLLVEGDPSNYKLVKTKNRKAYTAACCLAVHPYPHEVVYKQQFNVGKIDTENVNDLNEIEKKAKTTRVQCFTLFSLLKAIGVTTVDYFSLDVEGFEMDVLRTIPFHLVDIKVLTVEFSHGKEGTDAMIKFMATKGYKAVTKLTHNLWLANDVVFVHKDFPLTVEFPPVIPSENRKKILDGI